MILIYFTISKIVGWINFCRKYCIYYFINYYNIVYTIYYIIINYLFWLLSHYRLIVNRSWIANYRSALLIGNKSRYFENRHCVMCRSGFCLLFPRITYTVILQPVCFRLFIHGWMLGYPRSSHMHKFSTLRRFSYCLRFSS